MMNFTENDRKLLMFMAESTWDLLHFKGGSRLQYRVSTMTELRKAVESERAEATINKAPHCQPIVCNRPPWHDKPKRAEPTEPSGSCCCKCIKTFDEGDTRHELYYCDDCVPPSIVTVDEPTATEPDVPEVEQCLNKHPDGLRCVKRATGGLRFICVGPCNFGTAPDVPEKDQCQMKDADGRRCPNRVEHPGWTRCRGGRLFGTCQPDVPSEGEHRHCNTCGMCSHGTNAELRSQVDELRAKLKKANELAVLANNIVEKAGDA